jgi:hypothetical protein
MRGRPSLEKRRKELVRADRKRQKAERRAERRAEVPNQERDGSATDPDIAGIVPGPQPSTDSEP